MKKSSKIPTRTITIINKICKSKELQGSAYKLGKQLGKLHRKLLGAGEKVVLELCYLCFDPSALWRNVANKKKQGYVRNCKIILWANKIYKIFSCRLNLHILRMYKYLFASITVDYVRHIDSQVYTQIQANKSLHMQRSSVKAVSIREAQTKKCHSSAYNAHMH